MKRYIYLLVFGFLFTQTAVYAETIRGMIINLDQANNILSVRRTDNSKNTPEQVAVQVKSDTETKNVASLKELQVGHEVKIEAKENKTSGLLEAKSIEVTNGQTAPAQASSNKTPDSGQGNY